MKAGNCFMSSIACLAFLAATAKAQDTSLFDKTFHCEEGYDHLVEQIEMLSTVEPNDIGWLRYAHWRRGARFMVIPSDLALGPAIVRFGYARDEDGKMVLVGSQVCGYGSEADRETIVKEQTEFEQFLSSIVFGTSPRNLPLPETSNFNDETWLMHEGFTIYPPIGKDFQAK